MAGRKNLFEPVAEKLMLQIREGRLAPGEKMPSEHELCRHYSLSRSSIRKVLDYLEQRGLIRREPGVGSFVCEKDAGLNKPLTIGMTRLLSFSYASPIIPWVQRVAAAQNCHLLHADPHELNEEGELPFDAFLFVDVGGVSLARLAELSRRGFPITVLNRDWPEVATFRVDFYEEAKRAVRLLQRLGLKKIGAIDGERFGRYGNQCRMTGYEDAISEGGGKPFKLVRDFDSLAAVDSIAGFIRETRPDALFLPLIGVLDWVLFACKQAGRVPGRDITLFCFDRLEGEIYADAGIIYADMPLEKMGMDMMEYLIAKVRDPGLPLPHAVYDVRFVIYNQLLK